MSRLIIDAGYDAVLQTTFSALDVGDDPVQIVFLRRNVFTVIDSGLNAGKINRDNELKKADDDLIRVRELYDEFMHAAATNHSSEMSKLMTNISVLSTPRFGETIESEFDTPSALLHAADFVTRHEHSTPRWLYWHIVNDFTSFMSNKSYSFDELTNVSSANSALGNVISHEMRIHNPYVNDLARNKRDV